MLLVGILSPDTPPPPPLAFSLKQRFSFAPSRFVRCLLYKYGARDISAALLLRCGVGVRTTYKEAAAAAAATDGGDDENTLRRTNVENLPFYLETHNAWVYQVCWLAGLTGVDDNDGGGEYLHNIIAVVGKVEENSDRRRRRRTTNSLPSSFLHFVGSVFQTALYCGSKLSSPTPSRTAQGCHSRTTKGKIRLLKLYDSSLKVRNSNWI